LKEYFNDHHVWQLYIAKFRPENNELPGNEKKSYPYLKRKARKAIIKMQMSVSSSKDNCQHQYRGWIFALWHFTF